MSGAQLAAGPRRARAAGIDVRPGSVRQARQEAGLSRARLAEPELTRGAIYLIETGRSRPSMSTLRLIAARTGRPLAYFLAAPADGWQRTGAEVVEAERLLLAGRAAEAAERCEAALAEVADAHLEARAHRCLGRATLDLGRAAEARAHLERAREAFARAGDPWAAAGCLVLLAQAAGREGDPGALDAAEAAIAASALLAPGSDVHLAAAHAAAGDALAAGQRWEEAAERYARGLEHARRRAGLGEVAALYEAAAAVCEPGPAAEWRARAVALRSALRELGAAAEIHLQLGRALGAAGRPEAAVESFRAAGAEGDRLGLPGVTARALLAEAGTGAARGRLAEADRLLARATALAEPAGERLTAAAARCLRGRLAAAAGDAGTRDRELTAAIDLLTGLGATEQLLDAHVAYAEALEAAGDLAGALGHWKRAAALARPGLERPPAGA